MPALQNPPPIGGYFELDRPSTVACRRYPGAMAFQSCRAAFHALLAHGQPERVWVPAYTCDAMLTPLRMLGIKIAFYELNTDLSIAGDIPLTQGEWLVYVNYFGVCQHQEAMLLQRFPARQLVFDHAQAYYCPPPGGLATLYSPRKFFGVPDGGLLLTDLNIEPAGQIDFTSPARARHLLIRASEGPEAGYGAFLEAESSLSDSVPKHMSALTAHLLMNSDDDNFRLRRNDNFQILHHRLGPHNRLALMATTTNGPLCYPYMGPTPGLQLRLAQERIFVATYWPEVRTRCSETSIERQLTDYCLPLPCDHRYTDADMERVAARVLALSGIQTC